MRNGVIVFTSYQINRDFVPQDQARTLQTSSLQVPSSVIAFGGIKLENFKSSHRTRKQFMDQYKVRRTWNTVEKH